MAMNELNLNARPYDHILKVSRTIADLDGRPTSHPSTSAKRFNNRTLDRTLWVWVYLSALPRSFMFG